MHIMLNHVYVVTVVVPTRGILLYFRPVSYHECTKWLRSQARKMVVALFKELNPAPHKTKQPRLV